MGSLLISVGVCIRTWEKAEYSEHYNIVRSKRNDPIINVSPSLYSFNVSSSSSNYRVNNLQVYARAASIVTNLPIVGGILACGIILLITSLLGLAGAIRHHQVLLFFVSFYKRFLFTNLPHELPIDFP